MRPHTKKSFLFGPFCLKVSQRLLLKEGERVRTKDLTPKRFDLLCVLVQNRGTVMKKNDLIRAVWPDYKIDESDPLQKFSSVYGLLNNTVCKLRGILGDDPKQPKYIETVPGVGYKFLAEVEEIEESTEQPPREVAVLPFKLMTPGEPEGEYLGLGIASAVITKLNNIEGIMVRPRRAIFKYHASDQDASLAAHELGVDYVIGGFIYLSGKQIRVDAELLDAHNSQMLWSREYREEITDDLAVQETISKQLAHHIAHHFGLSLSSTAEARIKKEDTKSTEAYQAYVIGRYFWNRFTRADFDKAFDYYGRAIEADPNYAKAYAAKADCFIWKGIYNLMPPTAAFNQAEIWVEKAKQIDGELPSVHTSQAFISMCSKWDWAAAEDGFRKAIKLNPYHTKSRLGYALLHTGIGRFADAVEEIDQALQIYSVSLILNVAKGIILYQARQSAAAAEQFMLALEYDPSFDAAYYGLALSFERQGKFSEAIEAAQTAFDKSHRNPLNKSVLAYVHARAGDRPAAARILEELNDQSANNYISPFHLAAIHVALGEKEKSFRRLQEARRQRDPWVVLLGVDPRFDRYRDDGRFRSLGL